MTIATLFRATRAGAVALFGLLAFATLAQAEPGNPIGKTARVEGQAFQIYSNNEGRREVRQGDPVYLGDRFETSDDARIKIELADESRFTIGPSAAMVIDEFVYNPATNDGQVVASMLTGAFGFVSGKVAKKNPEQMAVKLPVGTIGIRGTAVAGRIDGDKAGVALLDPVTTRSGVAGQKTAIILANEKGQVTIDEYYHGTDIQAGAAPTAPKLWGEARIKGLLSELQDEELRLSSGEPVTSGSGDMSYPRPADWFGEASFLSRASRSAAGNRRTF